MRSWRDYAFVIILAVAFCCSLQKSIHIRLLQQTQLKQNTTYSPQRSISILATNVLQKNKEYKVSMKYLLRIPTFLFSPKLIRMAG